MQNAEKYPTKSSLKIRSKYDEKLKLNSNEHVKHKNGMIWFWCHFLIPLEPSFLRGLK